MVAEESDRDLFFRCAKWKWWWCRGFSDRSVRARKREKGREQENKREKGRKREREGEGEKERERVGE